MRKQAKAKCMAAVVVAVGLLALAMEAMFKFSLWVTSEYARFTSYTSAITKFTHNTVTAGREEVIRINRSIRSALPEINNTITGRLENSLLGNNCYVGYEESAITTWELPATTVGGKNPGSNSSAASVERNIQIQITHELSQLKTHLA